MEEVETPLLPPDVFRADEPTFIVAGGPSLAAMDLSGLRGQPMIVVNQSFKLFPGATVHFSADQTWVQKHGPEFSSQWRGQYSAFCRYEFKGDRRHGPLHKVVYRQLRSAVGVKGRVYHDRGFETRMNCLRGNNSGGFAINLSYHLGARLVVLLGFDMQMKGHQMHWYEESPRSVMGNQSTFSNIFLPVMNSAAEPAKEAGMRIFNATPCSALTCYPPALLEDFL